jgi:hypothetical protein
MKSVLSMARQSAGAFLERAKVRRGMLSLVAAVFVFQLYFVRELAAAELLFGFIFAVLLVLGGLAYLIGTVGERGLGWTESAMRVLADSARRGYSSLEEITRKSLRTPRSESAQ